MHDDEAHARLASLTATYGAEALDLRLGIWTIRLTGLDRVLALELAERWGPFADPCPAGPVTTALAVHDAGEPGWLPASDALYRLEVLGAGSKRVVAARQFAISAEPAAPERFRLGISRGPELRGRIVENAVRFILANLALDHGGFAMHAAGVLHEGRAFFYAGPSRSGKTTAVAASAPAASLGDDFGLVFLQEGSFVAPALPFDGSERMPSSAPRGVYPVAAIWRVYHGDGVRVERPSPHVATASLLSCAAFPWAYPERAGVLLDHVQRYVASGRDFAHLHFALGSDLFSAVLREAGPLR